MRLDARHRRMGCRSRTSSRPARSRSTRSPPARRLGPRVASGPVALERPGRVGVPGVTRWRPRLRDPSTAGGAAPRRPGAGRARSNRPRPPRSRRARSPTASRSTPDQLVGKAVDRRMVGVAVGRGLVRRRRGQPLAPAGCGSGRCATCELIGHAIRPRHGPGARRGSARPAASSGCGPAARVEQVAEAVGETRPLAAVAAARPRPRDTRRARGTAGSAPRRARRVAARRARRAARG